MHVYFVFVLTFDATLDKSQLTELTVDIDIETFAVTIMHHARHE